MPEQVHMGIPGYNLIDEQENLCLVVVICTREATLVSPPILFLDSYDNCPASF